MGHHLSVRSFLIGTVLLFALFCLITGSSISSGPITPPGCVHHEGYNFGGCFAKYRIPLQIKLKPYRCLNFGMSTCNGPLFDINNLCDQKITFEGQTNLGRTIYRDKLNARGLIFTGGRIGALPFLDISLIIPGC